MRPSLDIRSYRRDLIESLNATCQYCGRKGTAELGPDKRPWHTDHRIPQSRGGATNPGNLTLACNSCNSRKGARRDDEPWRELRAARERERNLIWAIRQFKRMRFTIGTVYEKYDHITSAQLGDFFGIDATREIANGELETYRLASDMRQFVTYRVATRWWFRHGQTHIKEVQTELEETRQEIARLGLLFQAARTADIMAWKKRGRGAAPSALDAKPESAS